VTVRSADGVRGYTGHEKDRDSFRRRAQEWAEQTTAAQGLPLHVTDRRVLAYTADILIQARTERDGAARAGQEKRPTRTSGERALAQASVHLPGGLSIAKRGLALDFPDLEPLKDI
jgi:hypothetical protein